MSGELRSAASSVMGRVTGVARSGLAKARSNPRSAGSAAVVGIATMALVLAIVLADGFRADSLDLDDSAVWVVNQRKTVFGRINTEIPEQDGVSDSTTWPGVDVIQDGSDVYVSTGSGGWSKVDPAELKLEETPITVPTESVLRLAGGTLAMLTGEGGLYVVDADQGGDLGEADGKVGAQSLRQFEPGAVMQVGRAGDVAVADPTADELVVVGTDGEASSIVVSLEDDAQVSLAGDTPVALSDGRLWLPGRDATPVEGDDPKLQLPGDDPDHVLVASSEGLWQYPVAGGKAEQLSKPGGGTPVAPVHIAGCTYGAWALSDEEVSVLYACDRMEPVPESVQISGTAGLGFRVNRTNVVLNDTTEGGVLAFADGRVIDITDWDPPTVDNPDGDKDSDKQEQALKFDSDENRPPEARPDEEFGARPGLPTIIPVLDNDRDPDNDVLTVDPPPAEEVRGGSVQLVQGGQALQVVPDPDAEQVTFAYRADDGLKKSDPATVTVTVFGDDIQTAPRPKEDREAARFTVGARESATYPVLDDWIDPEGDPIVLESVNVPDDAKAKVSSQPDGVLTYVDESATAGSHLVGVVVADAPLLSGVAPESAEGSVTATVTAEGQNTPPTARNDFATTIAGQAVVVWPLRNDTDPDRDPLSFTLLPEGELPSSVVDNGDGSVTVTPEVGSEGTPVLFGYAVTDGSASQQARIRVDVLAPDDQVGPSAALDVVVLPAPSESGRASERTQDLLINDYSPKGAVMVVTEVDPVGTPVQGLEVQLIEHRRLRVSYAGRLTQPAQFEYRLSDGSGEALGRVVVIPSASEENLTPLALDDEVSVRTGDVVSVPVLANDTDPEGATLHLDPQLAKGPDKGEGIAFVSGPRVRYLAPEEATTVDLTYVVADDVDSTHANTTTGRLRISVRDSDGNSPPVPPPVEARVLAGSRVKVTVPLSGVDPDGDSVTLVGLGLAGSSPNAPTKGRIVDVGVDTLTYEAFADSSGTDVFRYRVVDSGGAKGDPLPGEGTIRIGIARRPAVNQAPAARTDQFDVVPGSRVEVDPVANDYDPNGDPIQLAAAGALFSPTGGLKATAENGRVRLDVPDKESAFSVGYRIEDVWGDEATGTINVFADPDAPGLPPVARDDLAAPEVDDTAVLVRVLSNDEDPDGDATKLSVSTVEGAKGSAEVVGRQELRIELTDRAQVVPYLVTDEQNLTAMAVVRVPAIGESVDLPPELIEGAKPIIITDGQAVTAELKDHVSDPEGKAVRFATAKVTPVRVGCRGDGRHRGHRVSTPTIETGDAAVSVLVTDAPEGEGDGGEVVITIPVEVRSSTPQPPEWKQALEIQLSKDPGEPFERGLQRLVDDPDSEQLDFDVVSAPKGVDASAEDGVLRVEATGKLTVGARLGDIEVSVQDEGGRTDTALFPVVVIDTTKPLPIVPPQRVEAEAGKAKTVDVVAGAVNPFEGTDLEVVTSSPDVAEGAGSVSATPSEVTFTPDADFVGTAVVTFRVSDELDRQVPGTVTYTVRAKPGAPGRPSAKQVSASSVEVTYSGADDNDSPITAYTARSNDGRSTPCGTGLSCLVEGLTPGRQYTFTVFATNALGDGASSEPSPAVTPDECPGPPRNVQLKFPEANPPREGRTLIATWDPPAQQNGTAIEGYEVTVDGVSDPIDNPIGGIEVPLTGLVNGQPHEVTVRAQNRCEGLFGDESVSGTETPAGVPDAPADAQAVEILDAAGGRVLVSWVPPTASGTPNNNGADVLSYVITEANGRMQPRRVQVATLGTAGGRVSTEVSVDRTGAGYSFAVTATNRAGESDPSGATASVTARGNPGPVGNLSATDANGIVGLDGRAQLGPSTRRPTPVAGARRLLRGTGPAAGGPGSTRRDPASLTPWWD